MRIDNNGNVGIGTANPQSQLEVNANSKYSIPLQLDKISDQFGTDNSSLVINCSGPNCNYSNPATDLGVIRISGFGTTGTAINSNNNFVVKLNGNVGIGTSTPNAKLEIMGDISLPSSTGDKQIYTWGPSDRNWRIGMSASPGFTTSMATSNVQYMTYAAFGGQGFAVGVNGGQSSFEITGSNHNAFFRGGVGIGTTAPGSYMLAVAGKVAATGEVRVFNTGTTAFPDYVFGSDYKLPSLEETENYIKENTVVRLSNCKGWSLSHPFLCHFCSANKHQ